MPTIDEYIAGLDEASAAVARTLREGLDAALPEATGTVWHGHPVWMDGKQPVAGFKAYPRWVTLMVWGSPMATVKVTPAEPLSADEVTKWVLAQSH